MQLLLILAVVAALALAEMAPTGPAEAAGTRAALAVWIMLAVVALAAWGACTAASLLRNHPRPRQRWLRWFERFEAVHVGLWTAAWLAIFLGCRWPQLVRGNWGLAAWPLVDDLLLLAPLALPLAASWLLFYEVERADAPQRARLPQTIFAWIDARRRWRFAAAQMQYFGALLAMPVLLVLAVHDLLAWLAPRWAAQPAAAWVYVPLAPAAALALPLLLRRMWRTEALPAGELRTRLAEAAAAAGVKVREFVVWRTEGRLVNAAVSGMGPWRTIFLTDGLLAELNPLEIAAVVRHEAAHVRRGHVLIRLLVLLGPLWGWWMLCQFGMQQNLPGLARHAWVWPLAALVLSGGYLACALGAVSRLLEHDADLCACRTPAGRVDAAATATLAAALKKISPRATSRATWLHPSIDARIEVLRTAERCSIAPRVTLLRRALIAAAGLAALATCLV